MLRYIQYETSQDFFEQCSNFVGEPLVVCPNPQKADEARRRFDEAGHNFDTITISKFMQDQMKALLGEDATSKRKNKS